MVVSVNPLTANRVQKHIDSCDPGAVFRRVHIDVIVSPSTCSNFVITARIVFKNILPIISRGKIFAVHNTRITAEINVVKGEHLRCERGCGKG